MLDQPEIFDGSDRWLEFWMRDGALEDPNDYHELYPLVKLEAAPFAHVAHRLKTPAALRGETSEPILTVGNEGDGAAVFFEDTGGVVDYSYDAETNVGHDLTLNVTNSRFVTVEMGSTEYISFDRNLSVGSNETKTVSFDSDTTVGSNRTMNIAGNSITRDGVNIQIEAGNDLSLSSQEPVQLQEGVFVSTDPNDLLKVNGAVTMKPMSPGTPATAQYGKLFVNNADGKLYFIDTAGMLHDLMAVTSDRITFSVKRDTSYAWSSSSSFETIDFSSNTTIWDNTGGGFNDKDSAFVAPADGLYTFHGSIFFTDLAKGDLIAAAINIDGRRYRADAKTSSGTDESVRANITVYLQADDEVTLEGYVQTASSVNVFGDANGAEAFTYFNGARVD